MKRIRGSGFCLCLAVLLLFPLIAGGQPEQGMVLTSVGPVHQATEALLADTGIQVQNVPERPRPLSAQPAYFRRQGDRFEGLFRQADAVVTIAKVWPADPLYTSARQANIRIVNIDAAIPWSFDLTGIAVADSPVTGEASPYFWTSPSNIMQMMGIIARDLQALFPEAAGVIADNLESERSRYRRMKADFESRFLAVEDPVVYALTEEFIYLTRDAGIFVEDYFIKQDIDWTEEDMERLSNTLNERNIGVVIHKWEPSPAIASAIDAGGAELVVLDLLETQTGSLAEGIRGNLEKLLQALL